MKHRGSSVEGVGMKRPSPDRESAAPEETLAGDTLPSAGTSLNVER
jgi:hypothetical protein